MTVCVSVYMCTGQRDKRHETIWLLTGLIGFGVTAINPFRTPVPFWGQALKFQVICLQLSPKRDCSPKRVNTAHSIGVPLTLTTV